MFGKMRSSSLPPVGTQGDWLTIRQVSVPRKRRLSTRSSVENLSENQECLFHPLDFSPGNHSGMGCEFEYVLYCFMPSLGEGNV